LAPLLHSKGKNSDMKKIFTLTFALLIGTISTVFSQENLEEKNWKISGENTFLINQSSFSNWASGGINSFSGNLVLNYDLNYKKDKWSWDNKIIAAYGLSNQKSLGWRKNDDRLILNS